MRRYRDLSADAVVGNQNGVIVENPDGTLLSCGDLLGSKIRKSYDGGATWSSKHDLPASTSGRGRIVTASGAIIFATAHGGGNAGGLFRSSDLGETWQAVLTAPSITSSFWNMCQLNDGSLYAAEYNWTSNIAQDSTIYKSVDDGMNWSPWHVETVAAGAVRHTHWVDSPDGVNLYAGFGEASTPGTIHGGRIYAINSDGSLGSLVAVAANGGTGLAKSATGKTFILGDIHPLALLAFDSTANSVATQINFQTDISDGAYARYQYAWCLGRDGVIYVTGIDDDAGGPKYLYASADDGASWQVLSFNAPGKTPGGESLWASGPSGRLFIGEGSWRYMSVPDYTRAQLKRRFSV